MDLKFGKKTNENEPEAQNAPSAQQEITPEVKAKAATYCPALTKRELEVFYNVLGVTHYDIEEDTLTLLNAKVFLEGYDKDALTSLICKELPNLTPGQVLILARETFMRYGVKVGIINNMEDYRVWIKTKGFSCEDSDYWYDEIPTGEGDFGITLTNPVPIRGVPGSYKYLSWLRTAEGLRITTRRLGSFHAPAGITGLIDGYEVTDEQGRKCPTIYISPYHPANSLKAPKGYKLKL